VPDKFFWAGTKASCLGTSVFLPWVPAWQVTFRGSGIVVALQSCVLPVIAQYIAVGPGGVRKRGLIIIFPTRDAVR